ncbi:growth/differentiation factor 10b [Chaetodon trifascialis]|uniref:growth/differentiation factor 10b n=1 Tax=Chaetodon trifascialis TaxID=109706 RepID=UPI00399136C3
MDLAMFHYVFLVIVLLQAVAAHVEPPTDVILDCHNLHNVVKWNYDQLLPALKFRVDIGAMTRPPSVLLVDSPNLQADVSFLSDPSDDYYLTVTAVIGLNESDPAPQDGIHFSYFMDSPAHQKCAVDFPPVNVTAQQDGSVLFSFMHPWLLYHQPTSRKQPAIRRKKKSHNAAASKWLPEFKYDIVVTNQRELHQRFICEDSVCEGMLTVDPAQEKPCLKVRGEIQKILVQGTQQYCAQPEGTPPHEPNDYTYVYIIVVVVLALIAVVIILFMLYKKKTKPTTSFPGSMTFTGRLKQTFGVVQQSVLVPEVEPVSPTPLLSTPSEKEDKEFTPAVTSSTEPDLRLRIGVPAEEEGVCDVMEVSNGEGPVYIEGSLDQDEPEVDVPSDYEKRPVFVELAPNEQTEGYRG